jgi:hypothetical protein
MLKPKIAMAVAIVTLAALATLLVTVGQSPLVQAAQ